MNYVTNMPSYACMHTIATNIYYTYLSISVEYKRPTLCDVYKYVVPKYAHEWRFLGGLLHFDQAELDIIYSDYRHDAKECCRKLLSIWLERSAHASWNQLVVAIDEIHQSSVIYLTHQGMYKFK